jgi:NAD(P)-dependent dehydrogenase (short-subunit alcohol dehydrogenase family)
MSKLNGKVALITGGTTGIGAATAKLFQSEGATVIVTGQNPKTVDVARSELRGIDVILSDQRDVASSKSLIDRIKDQYDRIDVLFVNAGVAYFAPLGSVDEEFFDHQFGINVRGAYFVVKHAAPIIPDGGAIILTGSTAASSGGPAFSIYSATKAAVRSFGRTLAAELAPRNIRVNTVSPGPISTPILSKTGLSVEQVDGFLESMKTRVPLARIGNPEEVALTVLFLASDATFVTGGEIIVGGGLVDI